MWIFKRMVMVLIFWTRCYLNLGNTDLFLSYIHVTARCPMIRLLPVLYCLANFLYSPQSVDGRVLKFLIRLNKECNVGDSRGLSSQYPYSILASIHTVPFTAMPIFREITSGFSALYVARQIIKFIQKIKSAAKRIQFK